MTNTTENHDFVDFVHRLADRAGAAILPHFRTHGSVGNKSEEAFDPVTDADRHAEVAMRAMIEAAYPYHGIFGEEFPDKPPKGPHRWLLDPIDGTKAFVIGLPVWGTLIGLMEHERPIVGMMDQPYTGERFWGSSAGAFFRGPGVSARRIAARPCASLPDAILAATTPDMFKRDEPERFARLSKACRMTRFGGDCYSYCMLAMGFLDIVAEASLKPFDIVPLIPIIEAAGGKVTTWEGGDPSGGGRILAVGDPGLHEGAMALLAAK
ncbi:MAG: histidinol-phosphatase [Rhodomicrobium sp.]|nr:histidinol-phosphatase [Rhodomicrobium sp.]